MTHFEELETKQKAQVAAYAALSSDAKRHFEAQSEMMRKFLAELGAFLADNETPMCLRELLVQQLHAAVYNIATLHEVDDGAEGF